LVHSFRSAADLLRHKVEETGTGRDAGAWSAASTIGTALGKIAVHCVVSTDVATLCVAGGDTSSYAAHTLNIRSLEMASMFVRGAPICRIASEHSLLDGLPIVFKGGQVGPRDFFVRLANRYASQ
jgi:uncharacterized protein YgbK (DUF1537 family)